MRVRACVASFSHSPTPRKSCSVAGFKEAAAAASAGPRSQGHPTYYSSVQGENEGRKHSAMSFVPSTSTDARSTHVQYVVDAPVDEQTLSSRGKRARRHQLLCFSHGHRCPDRSSAKSFPLTNVTQATSVSSETLVPFFFLARERQ